MHTVVHQIQFFCFNRRITADFAQQWRYYTSFFPPFASVFHPYPFFLSGFSSHPIIAVPFSSLFSPSPSCLHLPSSVLIPLSLIYVSPFCPSSPFIPVFSPFPFIYTFQVRHAIRFQKPKLINCNITILVT